MRAAHSLAFALLVIGCATGGKDLDVPVDAPRPIDSSQVTIDAPRQIDAPASMIDAPILIDAPIIIDAAPGGFCNGNGDCTFAGECCFALGGPGLCVPGTAVGTACFPQ